MRHLLTYLALVGSPLIAMLAVVRAGEGMSAPAAIHGTYLLTTPPPGEDCIEPTLLAGDRRVVIAQSGPSIQVRLGADSGIVLRGHTAGAGFAASAPIPEGRHVRCGADSVTFEGQVSRTAEAWLLAGTLRLAPCDTCPGHPVAGAQARRIRHPEAR
ncbi:MAG: hypothetical protein ACREMH_08105 [Gemmatimonadales bacterium]